MCSVHRNRGLSQFHQCLHVTPGTLPIRGVSCVVGYLTPCPGVTHHGLSQFHECLLTNGVSPQGMELCYPATHLSLLEVSMLKCIRPLVTRMETVCISTVVVSMSPSRLHVPLMSPRHSLGLLVLLRSPCSPHVSVSLLHLHVSLTSVSFSRVRI